MRRSPPPAIATWLLRRLGPNSTKELIAGDLLEHYQNGRSSWWYWREVLHAISESSGWILLTTARAVIYGWLMATIVVPWVMRFLVASPGFAPVAGWSFVVGAGIGAMLTLSYRPHRIASIIIFSLSFLLRDFYRLIVPGIQLTTSRQVSGGRMHIYTWLLWSAMDLVPITGVLAAGIAVIHFTRTADNENPVNG